MILIVCGSISSWIEKNILSHTGFVGRITLNLKLNELPIHDAVKFWGSKQDGLSSHEIFSMLAVENIRRLCSHLIKNSRDVKFRLNIIGGVLCLQQEEFLILGGFPR